MAYDAPVQTSTEGASRGLKALVSRQLHVVRRLAQKAVELVITFKAEWNAPPPREGSNEPPRDLGFLAEVCAQVSRALHLTKLLKKRLTAELRNLDEAEYFEGPGFEPVQRLMSDDAWRAQLAHDLYQALAQEAAGNADQPLQPLRTREPPRPVDPLDRWVMTAPVEEVIYLICEHLNLDPDWLREVQAEWERENHPPPLAGEVARSAGGGAGRCADSPPPSPAATPPPRAGEDGPSPQITPAARIRSSSA